MQTWERRQMEEERRRKIAKEGEERGCEVEEKKQVNFGSVGMRGL